MQVWSETIGSFAEREGKYLICPIHNGSRKNYPLYRILEEPRRGDVVFHYVLEKASGKASAFTSFSMVKDSFYIVDSKDPLCQYPPPYRRVDLVENTPLHTPITIEMLLPYRQELQLISNHANITRSPFNKNFQIKQLYLARIPSGYIPIFGVLSGVKFEF